MATDPTAFSELGEDAEVDAGVTLGYRYRGAREPARIGARSRILAGSIIYADTVIGHHFFCGHNVVIRAECQLGDRVVILHGSTLEGRIRIGSGVKIMAHVYIPSRTTIGSMVFVGPGTTFLNARYPMRAAEVQGATIGNHVMIGGGVTIGAGVTLADNVFVGAGSVVVKDIPSDSLAYGNPARHRPMPPRFGQFNAPELIFSSADLWDNTPADDSWRIEQFPGFAEWQSSSSRA